MFPKGLGIRMVRLRNRARVGVARPLAVWDHATTAEMADDGGGEILRTGDGTVSWAKAREALRNEYATLNEDLPL